MKPINANRLKNASTFLRPWRRYIIGGLIIGFCFLILSVGAIGYGVYRLGSWGAQNLAQTELNLNTRDLDVQGIALPKVDQPTISRVQEMVLGATDAWLAVALENGDITALRHGLSCIETVSGIKPQRTLDNLLANAPANLKTEAERVASELKLNDEQAPASLRDRAASCVGWLST